VLVRGALLGWAFARMSLAHGFILAFVHHFAWKGVAYAAFAFGNWRVEVVAMLVTGMLAYGVIVALRWRRLRAGFFGVVKGDVLAKLLEEEGQHPELRGEERELTALFSDIRGFTRYSGRHTPREGVALLNTCFGAMVPIIERHGGMIDKYIGDGIMVLFGALSDQPDHAERAVRAAISMVEEANALEETWLKRDFPGFRIGVGIATGPALVGMIGTRGRMDFTAIGDTVNIAARIESANKELGTEILLSARTRNALDRDVRRELGITQEPVLAQAHGVQEGLTVYSIETPGGPCGPAREQSAEKVAVSPAKEPLK
jgi:adenylate cyclase